MKITNEDLMDNLVVALNDMLRAKITKYSVTEKIIDLEDWSVLPLKKVNATLKSIREKYKPGENFGVNRSGGFLSGDEKIFSQYEKEFDALMKIEIELPKIIFTKEDFKNTDIQAIGIVALKRAGLYKK